MIKAEFISENNSGILKIYTHFNENYEIICTKSDNEIFRLGGTAINYIASYEGIILNLEQSKFRAFKSEADFFDEYGTLSPENWLSFPDSHCWIYEYYSLNMEEKYLISKNKIVDSNQLFINLDILDGANNLIKRCRSSPFFKEYKWLM